MIFLPLLAVFLSGAGSLILEVVWTRIGILKYGSTVEASTIVFSLFMAGLAIGNDLSARALRFKKINPFYAYAFFEFLGAVAGLTTSAEYFIVTILASTISIGFTIPIVVRGIRAISTKKNLAKVYGANTLGASLGALTAAFYWIPQFGTHRSTYIGSLFMLVAGGIGIGLGVITQGKQVGEENVSWKGKSFFTWLALVSGFVGLSLEILWTRLLSLILGPSVYAIGGMLFVFLLGIAFGSFLANGLIKKFGLKISALWGLSSVTLLLSSILYVFLPYLFVFLVESFVPSPDALRYFEIFLIFLVLFPVALFQGALIPALVQQAKKDEPFATGKILSANTLGSILGACATGLILIPRFGFFPLIVVLSALLLLVSLFTSHFVERSFQKSIHFFTTIASISALLVVTLLQIWDQNILSSGVYKYAVGEALAGKKSKIQVGETLFFREGSVSTVSVTKTQNDVVLSIDGKADATFFGDRSTQVLLAALPLSLSEKTEKTLVIGYASGVTEGVSSLFEGNRVTAVEIEPVVYEAAFKFFQPINYTPLPPDLHDLIVADGRHFLVKTQKTFDVITSEPSNPWMSGVAPLFTQEFFELARSKLSKGGVMCQWLPIYGMTQDIVLSVIQTFKSVFPSVTAFYSVEGNDLLLIGGELPIHFNPKIAEGRWKDDRLKKELKAIGISNGKELWARFVLGTEEIQKLPGAIVNTDDNGFVEYRAPWAMHLKTAEMNDRMLKRAMK